MVRSRWIGAVAGMLSCVTPVVVAQSPVMQPNRVVNVREAGKPPRPCRVVACWKEADGSRICQVEALDNAEKLTIYEPNTGTMRVFKGHAAAPAHAVRTPISETRVVNRPVEQQPVYAPPSTPTPSQATPVVQANPVPATPSDWRESWGKVEPKTAGEPHLPRAEERPQPLPQVPKTTTLPSMVPPPPALPNTPPTGDSEPVNETKPTPPVVVSKPADPLENPELFTRGDLPRGIKPIENKPTVTPPTIVSGPGPSLPGQNSQPLTPPVTPPKSPKEGGLLGLGFQGTKPTAGPKPVAPANHQPLQPPTPRPRPGMASVVAATEEIRTVPSKGKPTSLANAMSLPNTPATPGAGVPSGAGNAFTDASTHRPIPSDMGAPRMPMPGPGMMAGGLPPLPPQPLPPAMQQQMMAAAAAEQQAAMAQMAMMQHQQMLAHQHAMAAATAAANAKTAPAADPATPKLLADLREALLPSQRELAAEGLRSVDWKTNPEVVTELTKAAKEDPSPMVRVACIKALGAMRASSEPVLQTLEALSTDSDSRIREEANEAKSMLQQKR